MKYGDELPELDGVRYKDVRLPVDPQAAGFARREIALVALEWELPPEVRDIGELCVSELVTNAILHGLGSITVRMIVLRRRDGLRIEVHDGNPELPCELGPSLTAESGRGLFIVAQYARDHGTYLTSAGKAVWAEIAAWDKDDDPDLLEAFDELHQFDRLGGLGGVDGVDGLGGVDGMAPPRGVLPPI